MMTGTAEKRETLVFGVPEPKPSPLSTVVFAGSVFAVICWVLFTKLDNIALFNPDEGLYSEIAREMYATGNYLLMYINYGIFHTKPPITFWLMAGSYHLFGVTEFGARFVTATCASILSVVTALFARKYVGTRPAWITVLILLTAPLFRGIAREAVTDMPLALFLSTSLMAFYHGFAQKQRRWSWVGYVLLGLAAMTKGPVGVVLPGALLFAYYVARRQLTAAFAFHKPLTGLLVTAVVAVPWFVAAIYKSNGGYFYDFLMKENFRRFTSVVDHKAPWWYHIAYMAGGLLPWTTFLVPAVAASVVSKTARLDAVKRWKYLNDGQSLVLFCTIVSLGILTFFSLSVTKLLTYTLPAFPFAAIAIACFLDNAIARSRYKTLAVTFALLAVPGAALIVVTPHLGARMRDCPPGLLPLVPQIAYSLTVTSAVACLLAVQRCTRAAVFTFPIMLLVTIFYFFPRALEVVSNYWEQPFKNYALFCANSNWPIIVCDVRKPSVVFYAHREIIATDDSDMPIALASLDHAYVISTVKHRDALLAMGCKQLSTEGGGVLLSWKRTGAPASPATMKQYWTDGHFNHLVR